MVAMHMPTATDGSDELVPTPVPANVERRRLVWFSCGAASAVAAKLAVEKYEDACEVVYCDTMATEHPDNQRFFNDVERWIGQ
jgi:hypothetical protein